MKKITLVMVAACAFAACAEDYTWTNSTAQTVYWTNSVLNWVDSQGNNPESASAITGDTVNVSFAQMDSKAYFIQTINWNGLPRMSTSGSWPWGSTSIGTISYKSDYPHRILNIANENTSVLERGIDITIGDPSGFDGYWSTSYGQVGLILPATESFTPRLSHISLAKRLDIEVPDAGTKAVVGDVYAPGTLVKRGAGELEVNGATGSDTQIHVRGGTLTLGGCASSPEDGDDLPVSGAWLHLDSTKTNAMQTYVGDDGRTYVTNWPDVRGNGNFAYYNSGWKRKANETYLTAVTHAPFLNTTLLGGVPVMDFGAAKDTEELVATYGPACGMLDFSKRNTNVREVFFVGAAVNTSVPILADSEDRTWALHRGGTYVLSSSYGGKEALNGTMFVNGTLVSPREGVMPKYTATDTFVPGVVSIATTNAITLGMIGADRKYDTRCGGIRICEIVIYTNVLTQIERMNVHRHLQSKWTRCGFMEDVDVGAMTLAAGTSVGVTEGTTAVVAEVTAMDGTLIKAGNGTLKIGTLSVPDGSVPKIDVRDGNVVVAGLPPVDDTRPAADPYLWLDANDWNTRMTISNLADNATNYVAEWYDHRTDRNDIYALLPVGQSDFGGVLPYIVENCTNGLAVVDFAGYGRAAVATYLRLNVANKTANAYEAYQVQAYKTSSSLAAPFFGYGSGTALMSGTSYRYLSTGYGTHVGRNARWTFNGVPVDPVQNCPFHVGEFVVGSVSLDSKQAFTLLGAKDRVAGDGTSNYGGVQLGEYIIYDRKLTLAERRQTIAYLMKRWLGRTPEYARPQVTEIGKMSFPAGSPATIAVEDDVKVGSMDGFNGEIVKKGGGGAIVSAMDCPDLSSIVVDEGSLTLDFTLSQVPAYDFDAMNQGSLTTEEWTPEAYDNQPAADTVLRTNVTAWADANSNGIEATFAGAVEYDATAATPRIKRPPTLRQIAVKSGVVRPMVDFGGLAGRYPTDTPGDFGVVDASALFFNRSFEATEALADFYTVFSDKPGSSKRQALITATNSTAFYRGDRNNEATHRLGAILDGVSAYSSCRNGFVSLDGVRIDEPTNTVLGADAHLVSFTPLEKQYVNTLAYCGLQYIIGGCRIGQQLAFKKALSPDERSKFLRYMMHKWFDEPWTFSSNTVDSITLNAGTTLTLAGEYLPDSISVKALGGSGEFVAASVTDVDTIDVAPEEGPFTVSGKVTFANAVTVNVAFSAKPEMEAYPIFEATELANVDLSAWTVDVQSAVTLHRTRFALRKNGDTICLQVMRPGTMLSFR